MTGKELAEHLIALRARVNEPKPEPLPEGSTRAEEAALSRADDKAMSEWRHRVELARAELVMYLPDIIAHLQNEEVA